MREDRDDLSIPADASESSAGEDEATAMGTYAVIWWRDGEQPHAGRLELRDAAARFSARGLEPLAVRVDDVLDVRIARSETTAGGGPTLVLRRRDGGSVFVRSVVGFGVLHELADSLAPTHPRAA